MSKKTFKANPAMQFINTAESKGVPTPEIDPKNVYYVAIEKKNRKMNLLFRQSLYDQIASMAESEGLSMNEYIHRILENHIKARANE